MLQPDTAVTSILTNMLVAVAVKEYQEHWEPVYKHELGCWLLPEHVVPLTQGAPTVKGTAVRQEPFVVAGEQVG
jgi:hypothetical protein